MKGAAHTNEKKTPPVQLGCIKISKMLQQQPESISKKWQIFCNKYNSTFVHCLFLFSNIYTRCMKTEQEQPPIQSISSIYEKEPQYYTFSVQIKQIDSENLRNF